MANLELISLDMETSYMAFGVSGSDHSTAMAGSDADIANFEDGEPIAVYWTLTSQNNCGALGVGASLHRRNFGPGQWTVER